MDTIIKVALGAWGGAIVSESSKENKEEKKIGSLGFIIIIVAVVVILFKIILKILGKP